MPSHRSPTIIALYDPDCPILCAELFVLKGYDHGNQIKLINIRAATFSAHAWGFAPESVEITLHVRDLAGHWHIAMDALQFMYRAVGLTPPLKRMALPHLRVGFVNLFTVDRLYTSAGNPPVLHGAAEKSIRPCRNDDRSVAEVNDKNSRV